MLIISDTAWISRPLIHVQDIHVLCMFSGVRSFWWVIIIEGKVIYNAQKKYVNLIMKTVQLGDLLEPA